MRMKFFSTFIFITILLLISYTISQEKVKTEPTFGIGLNIGLQKPFCDVHHTGIGLASEAVMRFLISNGFNLDMAFGYGELNDGYSYRTFFTNIFNADLKGNVYLMTSGPFRPYATLGFGAITYVYHRDLAWAIGSPNLEGKRFWDASFILGGGADIMLNDKWAVNALVDYRHTTSDGLDGAVQGDALDGYLNGRIGLTYYMGERPTTIETAARKSVSVQVPPDDLDQYDLFDTQPVPSEAQTLQARVDNLRLMIDERENDIINLQTQIALKDRHIADLEKELSEIGTVLGPSPIDSEYRRTYEQALGLFYERNYDQSIAIMTELRDKYPTHKLASNCQYWIGENNFGKQLYVEAEQAFQAVFNYSFSYKYDDATLMLGRCYQKLGQIEQAQTYFQKLLNDYPDSEYVPKAQEWLSRLQ